MVLRSSPHWIPNITAVRNLEKDFTANVSIFTFHPETVGFNGPKPFSLVPMLLIPRIFLGKELLSLSVNYSFVQLVV